MAETYLEIRTLAKDLSAAQDLSASDIGSYVNNWYRNKLPSEITLGLERVWRFSTLPYNDTYSVGAEYQVIEGTVRCNGEDLSFFTDESLFRELYPDSWSNDQKFGEGDASTTVFTGTLSGSYRLVPETVVLGDDAESFIDDGAGVLTGSLGGSGTVNYTTGAVSITFNTAPGDGDVISASFSTYNESTPLAVLYTNADTDDGGAPQLVFRPIPDSNYDIAVDYEARPSALSADDDEPIRKSWGDLIAYGTAIDILERRGDFEESANVKEAYKRILDTVLYGEIVTMSNKRPIPRW